MAYRPHTFASCFGKFSLTLAMVLYLCIDVSVAQVLQHKKPSEVLIKEYEKLVANGSLLTPEGWARASKLFEQSDQYPPEGEIQLVSAPGIIGETALSGDHAEVWTKWGTSYGTIDSHLRYRAIPTGGSVMLGESF